MKWALSLYASEGQALYEVALEEGICAENGNNDNDGAGHAQILVGQLIEQLKTVRRTRDFRILLQEVDVVLNVFKQGLKGRKARILDVEHTGEPVVPAVDHVEKVQSSQDPP